MSKAIARPDWSAWFSELSPHIACDLNSGCWIWTGAHTQCGYATAKVGGRKGRNVRLHRASYEYHKGPTGVLHVLHRCDTRACVNPAHLFLGTHVDNMQDMARKGRSRRSACSLNPRAKLTDAEVLALQARARSGERISRTAEARTHGVSISTISRVVLGLTWQNLPQPTHDV